MHRPVDSPTFRAGQLHHEDVVGVVVSAESLSALRGDVRIDLDRVVQLVGELGGEGADRRPGPVQRLQHDRGPARQLAQDPGAVDLVADGRPHTTGTRVGPVGQHGTVLGQPDERRTEPVFGDDVVSCGQ